MKRIQLSSPALGIMFHLAIPSHDLDASEIFYHSQMGMKLGRRESNYLIVNFYGHQLVCHLDPAKIDQEVRMYPRHFGIILTREDEYETLLAQARLSNLAFFKEDFRRFEGKRSEHRSFFLQDPSNNLIEFKWYKNSTAIF